MPYIYEFPAIQYTGPLDRDPGPPLRTPPREPPLDPPDNDADDDGDLEFEDEDDGEDIEGID